MMSEMKSCLIIWSTNDKSIINHMHTPRLAILAPLRPHFNEIVQFEQSQVTYTQSQ